MKRFSKYMVIGSVIVLIVVAVLITIDYVRRQPMEIYQLNIDVNKTGYVTNDSTNMSMYYVIYNTLFKSDKEVKSFIKDFNGKLVTKEMIEEFHDGLYVFYFRRSLAIDKEYEDDPGYDIIYDHLEDVITRCHYYIYRDDRTQDNIVKVSFDNIVYKVPINENNWSIITSFSELEKHTEFIWRVNGKIVR